MKNNPNVVALKLDSFVLALRQELFYTLVGPDMKVTYAALVAAIQDLGEWGTFREHSGNIQGTIREHSGNIHHSP